MKFGITRSDSRYTGKARPAVIMQVKKISETESIVVCLFTSFYNENISTRVRVDPTPENGLEKTSYIMVEKVVAMEESELGEKIGVLEEKYLEEATTILKDLFGF